MANNYFSVAGKTALITGGGSGLGQGYGELLAEQGADVILLGRNYEKLKDARDAISKYGRKVDVIQCDVSDDHDVTEKLGALEHVDILINNAGVTEKSTDITEHADSQWEKVIGANLSGTYRVSREVCKLMKRQRYGKVINISSIYALMGAMNQVGYSASKGGIVSLTRAMAIELAPYNITVNAVLPGVCASGLVNPESRGYKYFMSRIALGRIGTVEDLFGTILLLASDASKWMTGSVIVVDGGNTANL